MKTPNNQQKSENWIGGLIYFNRKDSRVIVPKRIKGIGWTLNFAHPYSYVMLLIIIAIIIMFNIFL